MQKLLDARLDEATREFRLSEAQVKKVQLAGKGDMKRFLDKVESLEQKLGDSSADEGELRAALLAVMEYGQARSLADLFGDGSLFSKTLASTLGPEQAALQEKVRDQKRRLRYQRAIDNAVAALERNVQLTSGQTDRLASLLRAETRAPRQFGSASDRALIIFQLSRLPEGKVRPIFDDGQWKTVERLMSAYRKDDRAQNVLELHGFVFEDDTKSSIPKPAAAANWRPKPR